MKKEYSRFLLLEAFHFVFVSTWYQLSIAQDLIETEKPPTINVQVINHKL